MVFDFDIRWDVVTVAMTVLSWSLLAYLIYRTYQKNGKLGKRRVAVITTLVGIFSFTFNFPLLGVVARIPLLPLGVWILYAIYKQKAGRWETYRTFAWLGFFANFIFIAALLAGVGLHGWLYPKDEAATYLADLSEAAIVKLHPSAEERMLNSKVLQDQHDQWERAAILNQAWYREASPSREGGRSVERFPYLLAEVSSKWGSGVHAVIYIEKDGKGFLVDSGDQQHYFRLPASVFLEVDDEN